MICKLRSTALALNPLLGFLYFFVKGSKWVWRIDKQVQKRSHAAVHLRDAI